MRPIPAPCLPLLLLICLATPAFAAPAALPPELVSAAETLGAHATVKARFEQTKSSVLFVEDMVRTGTLELRREDGRLLWTYDDGPAFLMADGRFYPAGKTAEEAGTDGAAGFSMPGAGNMTGVLSAVFTLDPTALDAHFVATVLGPGSFQLVPKGSASKGLFSKVLLTVGGDPLAVTQTTMSEPTGDTTVLQFRDIEVDGVIPPQRFMTPAERTQAAGK